MHRILRGPLVICFPAQSQVANAHSVSWLGSNPAPIASAVCTLSSQLYQPGGFFAMQSSLFTLSCKQPDVKFYLD